MQSFKLVEYIRNIHKFNIVKIENDEFRYKLKAYNLITKKGKIHINNVTKSKWSEYLCFQIYNVDDVVIGQYELNKYHKQLNTREAQSKKLVISLIA
jgi:hypothetical protein